MNSFGFSSLILSPQRNRSQEGRVNRTKGMKGYRDEDQFIHELKERSEMKKLRSKRQRESKDNARRPSQAVKVDPLRLEIENEEIDLLNLSTNMSNTKLSIYERRMAENVSKFAFLAEHQVFLDNLTNKCHFNRMEEECIERFQRLAIPHPWSLARLQDDTIDLDEKPFSVEQRGCESIAGKLSIMTASHYLIEHLVFSGIYQNAREKVNGNDNKERKNMERIAAFDLDDDWVDAEWNELYSDNVTDMRAQEILGVSHSTDPAQHNGNILNGMNNEKI